MSVLLDTHVWLWWLIPHPSLAKQERELLDQTAARSPLAISAISLWEAQMLSSKGRITLPAPFAGWIARATDSRMITVLPLDVDVVIALEELPPSFRGDPADRLIVATARAHKIPLATHDSVIRKSRLARLWNT